MAETITKLPIKTEEKGTASALRAWRPFDSLRREIDQLFDEFDGGVWRWPFRRSFFAIEPFRRAEAALAAAPAVDVSESDKAYAIVAELPGMSDKNVEVNVSDSVLTIKGEKQEEKEEKKKDYYVRERTFGSFERAFELPDGVDADKIEASFKNGVLTVTLPKSAEAQKPAKKIDVKAA